MFPGPAKGMRQGKDMLRIIAGTARGRKLEAPQGRDTRPTLDRVRENLFNMLQGKCMDARVLDLFAGSGALSLEALSRGAAFAVLADRDREASRIQRQNLENLGFDQNARVMRAPWEDTLRALSEAGERFDLVFLDPPYVMTDLREVTDRIRPMLRPEGWIVIEHQAKQTPRVAADYATVKARSWGYCGVTILAKTESAAGPDEENAPAAGPEQTGAQQTVTGSPTTTQKPETAGRAKEGEPSGGKHEQLRDSGIV